MNYIKDYVGIMCARFLFRQMSIETLKRSAMMHAVPSVAVFALKVVRACCIFVARSYTAVVSACGRAGQWQKAARYLHQMEASGTQVRWRLSPTRRLWPRLERVRKLMAENTAHISKFYDGSYW